MGRKFFRRRQVKNKQNRRRGSRFTLNRVFWWFACLRNAEHDVAQTDVSQNTSATNKSVTSSDDGGADVLHAYQPSDVTISIGDPTGSLSSQGAKSHDELHVTSVCERMGLDNVPFIPPRDLEEAEDEWGMPIFLGGGSNGAVQLMRIKSTQTLCAVKTQYKNLTEEIAAQNFEREVRVMMALQGLEAIPRFFGVTSPSDGGPFPAIVQEFVSNGDSYTAMSLYDVIDKRLFSRAESLQVAVDVCSSVRDMHDRGWLHCDLKGDNILLQTSTGAGEIDDLWDDVDSVASWEPSQDIVPIEPVIPKFTVKLIDFGMTVNMNEEGKYLHFTDERQAEVMQNSFHVSPEVIMGQRPFDEASEVFSIGRVLKDLSVVGEEFLLRLGDQCMKPNADKRPTLDDVINIINVRITSMQ